MWCIKRHFFWCTKHLHLDLHFQSTNGMHQKFVVSNSCHQQKTFAPIPMLENPIPFLGMVGHQRWWHATNAKDWRPWAMDRRKAGKFVEGSEPSSKPSGVLGYVHPRSLTSRLVRRLYFPFGMGNFSGVV